MWHLIEVLLLFFFSYDESRIYIMKVQNIILIITIFIKYKYNKIHNTIAFDYYYHHRIQNILIDLRVRYNVRNL